MSREAVQADFRPIEKFSDLLHVFERGERTSSDLHLGLEIERIGIDHVKFRALPFDGNTGVEETLRRLGQRRGWEPLESEGRTIGLKSGGSAVTLEPGGQLELSSRQHQTIRHLERDLLQHEENLREVGRELGSKWLALGMQPVTPLEEMTWVPKPRYRIMRKYYEKRKGLALHMMALTASIQANLDYLNETDARKKIRLGAALGPIVGAIFANGAVEGGKLNGYCTRRLEIWHKTDLDRCGVPSFFVDGTFSFEAYANYALDVPMYFLLREGKYMDQTNKTFRQFWDVPAEAGPATLSDWENHLTTLFPDVRLKDHLEFRTADSHRAEMALACMSFWKGLLYDTAALDEALSRTSSFSHADLIAANLDGAKMGLAGTIGKEKILSVARDVVKISAEGLCRLDQRASQTDISYLDPLRVTVDRGTSEAEETRRTWTGHADLVTFLSSHAC